MILSTLTEHSPSHNMMAHGGWRMWGGCGACRSSSPSELLLLFQLNVKHSSCPLMNRQDQPDTVLDSGNRKGLTEVQTQSEGF
jgi:hypothetical protein